MTMNEIYSEFGSDHGCGLDDDLKADSVFYVRDLSLGLKLNHITKVNVSNGIDIIAFDRVDVVKELEQKLDLAVDALKFYADSKNYEMSIDNLGLASCPVDLDDGSKAIDALKQIHGDA